MPFDGQDEVSLGVAVPKKGIYKMDIDHLKENLMLQEHEGVYIQDAYVRVSQDLSSSPYGFMATSGMSKTGL